MKKFKYILYIFVMSLLVVSCEDNTGSVTNPGTFSLPEEVKVSFTDTNPNPEVIEGASTTFRLGMNQAISGKVIVSLSVTSSDGGVEATYPSTVTLEDGQSAKYFDFSPDADGNAESCEKYTISITAVDVQFSNGNSDYFVYNGDYTRTVSVKDSPTPLVTTAGDLTFNFTWSGPNGGNDLDCRILDWPPTTIFDTGYSTTPGESVTLGAATADGSYVLTIRPWTVNDTAIDYNIEIVTPTETRTLCGTFTNLTGGWTMEFVAVQVDKVTNGADVTYTITQM